MKIVRIWYKKTGRAKYISHLDITRCMARSLKRAKVPAWYTQGFNPHLYMTFPLPISLGFESECECMDIKLEDDVDISGIKDRLNLVLPEGLKVFLVAEAEMKADEIAFALFSIHIECENKSEYIKSKLEELMQCNEINVLKRTKKGETTVDIKPFINIKTIELLNESLLKLELILPAGNQGNINPTLLLDKLHEYADLTNEFAEINKKAIYTMNMEEFK